MPTGYRLHSLVVTSPTDYSVPTGYIACTVALTTGYSVPTGYWLHSLVHLIQQLVTECTDRLNSLVQSFQQLVTECTHRLQPALNSLPYISRLQNLPASSWSLLISSLFTGLRLMTGLIVCSSWQEVFSYTETASTGYRAHQPVTGHLPVYWLQSITG